MAEFLASIAARVQEQLARRRRQMPIAALKERPLFHEPTRGFARSVKGNSRRIVAELKKASPSKGVIRQEFDPVGIAKDYVAHGASALSILTEEHFFHGSLSYLEAVRLVVPVPVLRKDFILDSYQLVEAKSYGADAILLIAALLDTALLRELRAQATELSLDCLVEVHTETELGSAIDAGAKIIGINNRDLKTFEVNLATTEQLAPLVPKTIVAVCESGIDNVAQIQRVENLGIHVFLIGESLMREREPGRKLQELLTDGV